MEEFNAHSPGCRQGTILAQVTPASGLCGRGTFWFDDATSVSRQNHVGSDAAELGPRRATLADVTTRDAQSEHNFGRTKRAYRELATPAWRAVEALAAAGPATRRRDGRDPTRSDVTVVTGRDLP